MPRVDVLWWDLEARWGKLDAAVTQAQKKLSGLATFIKQHPQAAFAGLAATIAIVGYQLTKMGVEFDTTMRRVASAMPGGLKALDALKSGVLDLSREVRGFSVEQLAAGLRSIIALGGEEMRKPATALERLRTAARAASASGEDLGGVIAGLDDVMDSFGLEGGQAADQLTRLFFAASQGRAPMGEFMGLMTKLGPFASEAGVGIRELAALIAASFESGMPPALAMRAFRQALAGVDEEGRKVPKTARDLGVEISMLSGHLEVGGRLGQAYREALAGLTGDMPQLADALNTLNSGPASEFERLMISLKRLALTLGDELAKMLPLHLFEITEEDRRILATLQSMGRGHAPVGGTTFAIPGAIGGFGAGQRRPAVGPVRSGDPLQDGYRGSGTPPPADARAAAARAQLLEDLRDRVSQLMGDTYAITMRQLDAIEAQFREKFGHAIPDEVTRGLAQLRAAAGGDVLVANLGRQMDALAEKTQSVTGNAHATTEEYQAQLAALAAERDWLTQKLEDETLSVEQHERIRAMLGQIAQLENQVLDAKKGQASAGKVLVQQDADRLERLQAQARNIEAAARGALQLARAFGIVDENTAAALENVAQIAANALTIFGKGGGINLGSVLGIAGGVAGLIGSLFGGGGPSEEESAEAEALREQLEKNNAAIQELTRAIGDSARAITGREYAGIRAAAATAMAPPRVIGGGLGGPIWSDPVATFNAELDRLGITAADVERVFQELGLQFDGVVDSIEEIRVVAEALANAELDRLATTFSGQMELFQRTIDGFDITDPIEQLTRLQAVIAGLDAGALQGINAFDLTTAEGRAAADAWMQGLFAQATGGGLTPEQVGALFGGLTPQEWLDAWAAIETAIDRGNAGGAVTGGGQQQWGVNRTITEATATRQLSLMTTMAYWLEVIAADTGIMSSRLAPPTTDEIGAFHARMGGGDTVNVSIGNIVVHLGPGVTPADGQAIGQAAGSAAAEELNRQLYQLARRRARALGKATLS